MLLLDVLTIVMRKVNGALDDDSDDDGLSTRMLELNKEFNKAWKHW